MANSGRMTPEELAERLERERQFDEMLKRRVEVDARLRAEREAREQAERER